MSTVEQPGGRLGQPAGGAEPADGQRARILERMTPTWRAARLHEPFSGQLQRHKAKMLAAGRAELEAVFARELAGLQPGLRRWLLDSLHAISIWPLWESLRAELGLDPRRPNRSSARPSPRHFL